MVKALAINGSPRKEKGNTALILRSFIEGLEECGADVDLYYASKLKIKPCSCGRMLCWYDTPGECPIQDEMQLLYQKLNAADLLILATPVYTPLPGDMQNIINRLCPLVEPFLESRQGRTRPRFHKDVNIKKIMVISTSGWWEKENMSTVVQIVEELAENAGVEFGGALLRPHAFLMKKDGILTREGEQILLGVKQAAKELLTDGKMSPTALDLISRPLITEEELLQEYNQYF